MIDSIFFLSLTYRRYTRTISQSLFFFNLLPVTILDGGHLLEILLECSVPHLRASWTLRREDSDTETMELEELERGRLRLEASNATGSYRWSGMSHRLSRWGKKGLLGGVNYCVLGMCGVLMVDAFVRT